MRINLNIDGGLLQTAQRLTAINDVELINEALRLLIQRKTARQLIRLGGTEPMVKPILRHRERA
jgi:hypothetical protein